MFHNVYHRVIGGAAAGGVRDDNLVNRWIRGTMEPLLLLLLLRMGVLLRLLLTVLLGC